jgi:TPR repeat protein
LLYVSSVYSADKGGKSGMETRMSRFRYVKDPKKAQGNYNLGMEQRRIGVYGRMITYFTDAAKLGHDEAQMFLGEYYTVGSYQYWIKRDFVKAERFLSMAFRNGHAEDPKCMGLLGLIYLENGLFSDAYPLLEKSAKKGDAIAIECMVRRDLNDGNLYAAKQWITPFLPSEAQPIRRALAAIKFQEKEYEAALLLYRQLAKEENIDKEAIYEKLLLTAKKLNRTNYDFKFLKLEAEKGNRQAADAIKKFNEENPGFEFVKEDEELSLAEEYVEKAVEHRDNERFSEALHNFEMAAMYGHTHAQRFVGSCYVGAQQDFNEDLDKEIDFEKAKGYLNMAVSSGSTNALGMLGLIHYETGEVEEGIMLIRSASNYEIDEGGKESDYRFTKIIASIFLEREDYFTINYLMSTVEAVNDNPPAILSLIVGRANSAEEKYEKALKYLIKAIDSEFRYDAFYDIARVMKALNRRDDYIKFLTLAARNNDDAYQEIMKVDYAASWDIHDEEPDDEDLIGRLNSVGLNE